jgi:hypothetical protein
MNLFSPTILQTLDQLNAAQIMLNQSIQAGNHAGAIEAALEIRIAAGELRNELQRNPDAD